MDSVLPAAQIRQFYPCNIPEDRLPGAHPQNIGAACMLGLSPSAAVDVAAMHRVYFFAALRHGRSAESALWPWDKTLAEQYHQHKQCLIQWDILIRERIIDRRLSNLVVSFIVATSTLVKLTSMFRSVSRCGF